MTTFALLAAIALAAGDAPSPAAPARPAACSLPRAASWREYRSRHFLIDATDAGPKPERLVQVFEELHAAVVGALVGEPVEIPGRVRVIVLPRERDVGDLLRADFSGFFTISRLGEPVVVVSADALEGAPYVIAHELAHHVSHHLFPWQPRWFAEGLAQFVESVARVDGGKRWAAAGPQAGWAIDRFAILQPEDLFRWSRSSNTGDLYASAWILYRYLWNDHGRAFSAFQRRLSDGERPAAAWRAVFPRWDPEDPKNGLNTLRGELQRHRTRGEGLRYAIEVGQVDCAFTTHAASTADLHLLLEPARTSATNPMVRDRVRDAEAAEALAEEPHHPGALALRARGDRAATARALRASAAARPGDWRTWHLLAAAVEDPAEREVALRRAIGLEPDAALANAALAEALAAAGRPREGLAFANRALDLAPWHPAAVAALADVAGQLGRCEEALLLGERAIAAAAGGHLGEPVDDAPLKSRLAALRTRCGAAASP
ncbi:MAG: hypothetical protein ACJ79R_24630 [Anaeromyxobacteraceae bacterium]